MGAECMKQYLEFWKQAFNFTGETSRYTYWYMQVMNGLIALMIVILSLIGVLLGNDLATIGTIIIIGFGMLLLFTLVSLLPEIALSVRRLRNAGLPWALVFLKVFNTIFSILMLMPAKKAVPRLERKERFYWLGALGMVISLVGAILIGVTSNGWGAIVVLGLGLVVSIAAVVFNMKRRRLVALISLAVAVSAATISLGVTAGSHFNQVYERSNKVSTLDTTIYNALKLEPGNEGRPVSELLTVTKDEWVEADGVKFDVISTKQINDDYVRVALDIENTGKEPLELQSFQFELADSKDATRMLEYDVFLSELDLNEYNFRLIDDQVVEPGETLKGTLTFMTKISDAKYLVIGQSGEREAAFELK